MVLLQLFDLNQLNFFDLLICLLSAVVDDDVATAVADPV